MRLFKLFLISLLVFFVFLTAVGLLFPSTVRVSRAVDLPGQQKAALIRMISNPVLQTCWRDTTGRLQGFSPLNDSTLVWIDRSDLSVRWIFHGKDGAITLQALATAQLSWQPWERFKSLLMEPRYGPWMEANLTAFKRCLDRYQLDGGSP